jgi:integrase
MARKAKVGRWISPEDWGGKRAWLAPDGTVTYYIRRTVNGRAYDVSTRATTRAAAEAQLRRFEADPSAYQPGGDTPDPIYLDAALAEAFLRWSLETKGNSPKYVNDQRHTLAWWAEKLAGVDLRRCSLRDRILPALNGQPGRQPKIATLKVLYSWLRAEVHRITTVEDPTFGQLKVPQSKPEQARRPKALPREHVQLVIEHLASERWRDLLRVLAGTGMHVSELERFASSGTIEPVPRNADRKNDGTAGVIVIDKTKAGDPLRVAVSAEVVSAAKRVLAAGAFDRQKLDKAIRAACKVVKRPDGKVGIPEFGPGQLRHSVATWAIDAGADPAQVSAYLNHKSPRTTRRFYGTHATPAKVPTLL